MDSNPIKLMNEINYLNKKFDGEFFDEKYIKEMLKKDIMDFHLYIKSNIKSKQKPINNIRSSLQEILELNEYDFTVYVFGSYATGLCLPWSDLDLILISKNPQAKYDENYSKEKLKEIQNLLSQTNWVDKNTLKFVNYRAFPYLKFSTDEKHGFMKVNLTIKDMKNKGYECAKLTSNFLKSYKSMEPIILVLKNLMYYSKTLFSLSEYYENQKENLNSYSIVLMVVFFIQYQIMQINIQTVNSPEYIGELFINLLQYYNNFTEGFVFVRTGIEDIIENRDFLELKQSKNSLVVIDPLNHKNNVFGKDIIFDHIKIIFKVILNSSKVKCDCSCHYIKDYQNKNGQNISGMELGTEHCILKKMFKTANRINPNIMNI
jgi:DNA polymerase sigma